MAKPKSGSTLASIASAAATEVLPFQLTLQGHDPKWLATPIPSLSLEVALTPTADIFNSDNWH